MNKYTALTEGYDRHEVFSDGREVIKSPDMGRSANTRFAREHKIRNYRAGWWIDGSIRDTSFLTEHEEDLVLYAHPFRRCAFKEAEVCIQYNREDKLKLHNQIRVYEAAGFPKDYGLMMTGLMWRRKSAQMDEFMRLWWQEICVHSSRDQVSLPYCLWKYKPPIKVKILTFDRQIKIHGHRQRYDIELVR